ncbi:protoporphyrinogen/coproporphyrinogen oxidase [Flavobacterium sp. WC2509]|uniref:protoporphyrinogen/coproporphyrinogen oxidase n=1 Tax=Flavobacterium sp. WC2509 TaxID=3461406 RepID=UPI00404443C6
MKVAVIGGGISGLSIARMLEDRSEVTVFEAADQPGGLIKCERVNGTLYHMVGGHVFNSRRQDVLDWFWGFFDREEEFTKATRNAIVYMGRPIGYPIENHIYQFDAELQKKIITDLLKIAQNKNVEPTNFEEFLKFRFGETLYNVYFKPYNEKVWKRDLSQVPLTWLAGKLPMPSVEEIIFDNFNKANETTMVHSTFYYAKNNGSQFLADRLAEGLNIIYNAKIKKLEKKGDKWSVNGIEFDKVVFCGNIKDLPSMLEGVIEISSFTKPIEALEYHGTTSVLCEIDKNPFSWIYMPDETHHSHRIICTGNFSETNNGHDGLTATIEFTDEVDKNAILENLKKIPYSPKYLSHRYTQYTYPIQNASTREVINNLKELLEAEGIYLLGRFAEWEYYNMDAAIGAAIDLSKTIQ